MVVTIVENMKKLGFSEYESKAYIALLEENPATAYEISKKSGIPSSKIYETMTKLLEREVILELIETGKKRYLPVEPKELISNYSDKITNTLAGLKNGLENLPFRRNVSYVFNINDYESLLKKSKSIIISAQKTIMISAWTSEIEAVKCEINSSKADIAVVNFGESAPDLKAIVYPHPVGHTLYSEKGGRQFVISADATEAISGTIYENGTVHAAWSRNEGFVSLAEDFIKHDIYILKVANRFNNLLISTYGNDFEKLRNIFSDEVIE